MSDLLPAFLPADNCDGTFAGRQPYTFPPASNAGGSFTTGNITAVTAVSRPYGPAVKAGICIKRPFSGAWVSAKVVRPYGGAVAVATTMRRYYRGAAAVVATCVRPYAGMIPAQTTVKRPYSSLVAAATAVVRPYAGLSLAAVEITVARPYGGTSNAEAAITVSRPYSGAESASASEEELVLLIDGQQVDPVRVSITWSRQQSAIEVELECADAATYELAQRHKPASVDIWGYSFQLVVDGRSRHESFGEHSYTVRLASPAVRLESPWAAKVAGELSGMASAIARQLTGALAMHWQTVDWYILPGRWLAAGESPLALLQQLVSAAGAVLLAQEDGGMAVQPLYPIPVPDWPQATGIKQVSAVGDIITLESSGEHRDVVNLVAVGDQQTAKDTLTIEEDSERKNGDVTQVLVYQTPWRDDFRLTHRGDAMTATVVPMGVEERTIMAEEIIIQDGEGRAAYPIYAILSAHYNKHSLGTPTYSEDGSIATAILGDSILLLSYRTRARRYQARESAYNDLLLVAESDEEEA